MSIPQAKTCVVATVSRFLLRFDHKWEIYELKLQHWNFAFVKFCDSVLLRTALRLWTTAVMMMEFPNIEQLERYMDCIGMPQGILVHGLISYPSDMNFCVDHPCQGSLQSHQAAGYDHPVYLVEQPSKMCQDAAVNRSRPWCILPRRIEESTVSGDKSPW